MKNTPQENIKPFLRGHFHQAAFFFAAGAGVMLIARSATFFESVATTIYTLCLCSLFGVSALYHRPQWSPQGRKWMRRLDHSAIFLLIAGTSTPLCLLAIPEKGGYQLLKIVWLAAVLGILQSLFWVNAPKWLAVILYIAMGWLAFPYLPELKQALGASKVHYILAGGVIYTVGAIIYGLKKPNPFPRIFGYHEIFHLLVILAAGLHFWVLQSLLP